MSERDYQHILLAVDFAPETERVIYRAEQLWAKYRARLSLVHVVEYVPMSYSGDLILPEDFDLERELLDVAEKQMEALGQRLRIAPQRRFLEVGRTGKTILRVADEQGVDLIVLGSHGRHGLTALVGSTARSVLNGAQCDVLAVRVTSSSTA